MSRDGGLREDLRASEERFRLLVESVGDYAIFLLDAEGRVASWNAGAERTHGYRAGEILGQLFSRFYPGEDGRAGKPARHLAAAAADGRVEDEGWRVRKDGSRFWANVVITALRGEDGALLGFAEVTRDLTERKRAEDEVRHLNEDLERRVADRTQELVTANEQLRDSEGRFRAIVQTANEGIWLVDAQGRTAYANDRMAEMLGLTAAEMLGRTPPDFCFPEDAEAARGRIGRNFRGDTEQFDFRFRRRDGREVLVLAGTSPMRDDRGQVVAALGMFTDVTARKQAERELRETNEQLLVVSVREREAARQAEAARRRATFLSEASAVLASSLEYETTLEHVARLAVPAFADYCLVDLVGAGGAVYGVAVAHSDPTLEALAHDMRRRYPPDPSVPHPVWRIFRTGRGELLEVDEALLASFTRSAEHRGMLRALDPRSWIAVPLVARGQPLGVMNFVHSASGRRYGPDELVLAQELAGRAALAIDNARLYADAQAALRVREAFLARASHELRTPLTSLHATVQLLTRALSGRLMEPPGDLVAVAARSIDTMLELVNSLLDASKLAGGRDVIALEEADAALLVRRSLEMVAVQARDKGVAISTAVAGGLRLRVDPLRFEQVLVNLLGNAITCTPPGGTIALEARTDAARATILVRDTGEGIAPEHLERVFEPFFQAERTGQPRRRGTGLGLAICRQIVELHGGRIWAESEGPGRGATFVVTLPAPRPEDRAA